MLARALRAAPSRSLSTKKSRYDKVYELTARGEACACTTRVRQHTIRTDTPKLSGGMDTAAQPVELLLAALVGCETATAHFVARGVLRRFSRTGEKIVTDVLGRSRASSDTGSTASTSSCAPCATSAARPTCP